MFAQVPSGWNTTQLQGLFVSRDWRDWVVAAGVLAASLLIALIARRLIARAVRRAEGDERTARLVGRLVTYTIVALAVVVALGTLQIRGLGAILGAMGVFGIALAFALRDTLENLLAGLFLQMSRPFRRGDNVETAGFEGVVEDVTLRNVQLLTSDGELVLIPSATVYRNPITNYSRMGRRRAVLELTLAPDVDVTRAKEVILDAVGRLPHVLDEPAPVVLMTGFAAACVQLSVRTWFDTADASRVVVGDRVACAVKEAIDAAGIELGTDASGPE